MTDYEMSKEFGLDWKKQDGKRMLTILFIKKYENLRDLRQSKKNNQTQTYGRKR